MPRESVKIGNRDVGSGNPCFIIAEVGINHNGSEDLALRLVDAARSAGADAVKFQSFRTEGLLVPSAPKADYQKGSTPVQESQFQMLKRVEMSESVHCRLQSHCRDVGIMFLSSPFEEASA